MAMYSPRAALAAAVGLVLLGGVAVEATNAAVLYSATAQTGTRFNPGPASLIIPDDPDTFEDETFNYVSPQQQIVWDDFFIANSTLAPFGGIAQASIFSVQVGIRRGPSSVATTATLFLAENLSDGVTYDGTAIGAPIPLATVNLPATAANAAFVTSLVTVTIPGGLLLDLNPNFSPDFSGAFVGLQLGAADGQQGWRVVTGASVGAGINSFFLEDPEPGSPVGIEGPFTFGAPPAPPGNFYAVVQGVPEPTALGLLAPVGMMLARRRRA